MVQLNANHILYLLAAAQWTVLLSLLAFAGGALVGLPVALMRVSRLRGLRIAASTYIQLVQGTPLLIILFLSYFGLGILGLKLEPIVAAALALTVYAAAFLGEIWRGCIEAVPKTQWEASDCLGLHRVQQYAWVILPQAVRIAIPPTVGFYAKLAVLQALIEVAGRTWQIWDPAAVLSAVREREQVMSTGFENGVAIPHPRNPLPDVLGQSLVAFGRTSSGIPFGAPKRTLSDLFFLVLARDARTHLQILARLGRLLQTPDFLDQLRHAGSGTEVCQLLLQADSQTT